MHREASLAAVREADGLALFPIPLAKRSIAVHADPTRLQLHYEGRTPTRGHAPTREAALAAVGGELAGDTPLPVRVKSNDAPFFRYHPEWGTVCDPEEALRRLYTAMALAQPSRS